jgi:histidine phosphotransferase ChpT
MADTEISPEQLASAVAARLIHDVIGPASGIVSAFDLIADPTAAAMREEALALAEDSARKLVGLLALSRAIHAGGAALTAEELRGFADRLFEGSRATLHLTLETVASPVAGRLLLGLLQIAASAVAAGGSVTACLAADGDRLIVEGSAAGPRLRIGPEVLAGLAGQSPGSGPLHRWSTAYVLAALAGSAGGAIDASVAEGVFVFRAVIRAEIA